MSSLAKKINIAEPASLPSPETGSKSTYAYKESSMPNNNMPFSSINAVNQQAIERAAFAKAAGRLNASLITEEERKNLMKERKDIIRISFCNELTPAQKRRKRYIEWSLDRIDDARYGKDLDELSDFSDMYKKLASEIGQIKISLQGHLPTKRKR